MTVGVPPETARFDRGVDAAAAEYGWRHRLALWCLRKLAPSGLFTNSGMMGLKFSPGQSTQDDPVLCIFLVDALTGQTIAGMVSDPPEQYAQMFAKAAKGIRHWAADPEAVWPPELPEVER